jgi:hypothetical protein
MRFWIWLTVSLVFVVLGLIVAFSDIEAIAAYARGLPAPSQPSSRWPAALLTALAVLALLRAIRSARRT